MVNLEAQLIQDIKEGKSVSLERGLLILSGLRAEREIAEYSRKLDRIHNEFIENVTVKSPLSLPVLRKHMAATRAKLLFEYLWNTKPKRCDSNFLLTDVIDAQLNSDIHQTIGSCVGLTALYTVLGLREGLNLTIVVSDSHILNRLKVDEATYNIDNTDPLAFDCDLEDQYFVEYPVVCLLAHVLNSRGMARERVKDLKGANEDYNKAIEINPKYANAYNNRGNIKSKQMIFIEAIKDYNKAIDLNSQFVEAYCNRGIAKENLGDNRGAIKDFDRAIEIHSEYSDAYFRRALVKQNLGNYSSAINDFDRVIKLEPESREKIMSFKERAERSRNDVKA